MTPPGKDFDPNVKRTLLSNRRKSELGSIGVIHVTYPSELEFW